MRQTLFAQFFYGFFLCIIAILLLFGYKGTRLMDRRKYVADSTFTDASIKQTIKNIRKHDSLSRDSLISIIRKSLPQTKITKPDKINEAWVLRYDRKLKSLQDQAEIRMDSMNVIDARAQQDYRDAQNRVFEFENKHNL